MFSVKCTGPLSANTCSPLDGSNKDESDMPKHFAAFPNQPNFTLQNGNRNDGTEEDKSSAVWTWRVSIISTPPSCGDGCGDNGLTRGCDADVV